MRRRPVPLLLAVLATLLVAAAGWALLSPGGSDGPAVPAPITVPDRTGGLPSPEPSAVPPEAPPPGGPTDVVPPPPVDDDGPDDDGDGPDDDDDD